MKTTNKLKITKLILSLVILVAMVGALAIAASATEDMSYTGSSDASDENHEHDMADATCTEPSTCTLCGHTEGYALTHSWVDSEIQGKKVCTVCGELLIPDFNFVTRPYVTLAETGFDVQKILGIFPREIETKYENGKYMIKDIGAFAAEYFDTHTCSRLPMTLEDGYWTIELSKEEYDAVIAAGEKFCIDFHGEDRFWYVSYHNGRMQDGLQIATPGNVYGVLIQTSLDIVEFFYPLEDRHCRDSYLGGSLFKQEILVYIDDYNYIFANYLADGTLDYVSVYVSSEGNYFYYVNGFGWATNSSGNPEYACNAPAGYEDADADFFMALAPTTINCPHEEYSAADCYKPETCLVCGIDKEGSTALGHDYNDGVITAHPTCTEKGEKTFTCLRDNRHKYTEDMEIDENAHDWDDGVVTAEPTCTEKGEKLFTCSHDDEHTYTEDVEIDENAHDWDEGIVTTEPTCTEKGEKLFTCLHDDEHTYTEDVDALEHDWIDASTEAPKTCNTCGATEGEPLPKDENPDKSDDESGNKDNAPNDVGEKGCGSTVSVAAIAFVSAIGIMPVVFRKKEDR